MSPLYGSVIPSPVGFYVPGVISPYILHHSLGHLVDLKSPSHSGLWLGPSGHELQTALGWVVHEHYCISVALARQGEL